MMRKHILYIITLFFALTSCLKNDIPYPRIQANFLSFEVDGALKPSEIDSINKVIIFCLSTNKYPKHLTKTLTPNSSFQFDFPKT